MKQRNKPWAIVCSASGFTGPTIVTLAETKDEARIKLDEAMKDFQRTLNDHQTNNTTCHSKT